MFAKKICLMLAKQASFPFSVTYYKKINPETERYAILVGKIRSAISFQDALSVFQQNFPQIQEKGKTIILQFFNEFYMDQRYFNSIHLYVKLQQLINKMTNLSFYQLIVKLSVLQKLNVYFMSYENREEYMNNIEAVVKAISQKLQTQQMDIINYMNILCIFRAQKYGVLVRKSLSKINDKVLKIQNGQNIIKTWGIVIYQLSFIQWSEIRKYTNFIKFLTDNCGIDQSYHNSQYQGLIHIFRNICLLQLHKVGLKRMPILIKQIIEKLKPLIETMPLSTICNLLKTISYLPASYHSEFQAALMKKLYSFQRAPIICYKIFPFRSLSIDNINYFYGKPQNCSYLWYEVVYQTNPKDNKYFYRGSILKYFQNFVMIKAKNLSKIQKTQKSPQNAARYCQLAQIFQKLGNQKSVSNTKAILVDIFSHHSVGNVIEDFSFANFITLMILFQKDPIILSQVKQKFQIKENLRKNKIKFVKYNDNALLAIEAHIECKTEIGKQMMTYFIKQLINKTQKFNFQTEGRILLSIINANTSNLFYQKTKNDLFEKMTVQDIQCFSEYFLLCENKTFKGAQEIINKLIFMKANVKQMLKFISSLSINYIQNRRGKLQTNLNKYLLDNKQNVKASLLDLNQINRAFSLLVNYSTTHEFLKNLYLQSLQVVQKQIENSQKNKTSISTRLVLQAIFKFQEITVPKQLMLPANISILKKVYGILKKLIKKQKQLYVKIKFLQFYFYYKDYIGIPQGQDIQNIYQLQKILNNAQSLIDLSEICLIFLELHCFKFIKLQQSQIVNYQTAVSQSIKQSRLTIFQVKKIVNNLSFHFRSLKLRKTQFQLFKTTLNPLFIESLSVTNQDNNFHIMRPFILYFNNMNQLQKIEESTVKMLQNYISPTVIEFIVSKYSYKKISKRILQLLIDKISLQLIKKMMNSNSIQILFFFQTLFFENPSKYTKFIEMLWNITNRYLEGQIQQVKTNQMSEKVQSYTLGRYPLYMYACIKAGKTEGNKIFQFLANILISNPTKFNNKIEQSQFLSYINNHIIKYVMVDQIKAKDKILRPIFGLKPIEIGSSSLFSKNLNEYLKKQNISFKVKYKIENFIVPYYLQQKKQIILIAKYRKQNDLQSDIPLSGVQRFQYEVAKKAMPQYKIKIYNDFTQKFIQI